MSYLRLENNKLIIDTPYDQRFIDALKDTIPANDRFFDWDKYNWVVAATQQYVDILSRLITKHYGIISGSKDNLIKDSLKIAATETERRKATVYWLGQPKSRQGQENGAYATTYKRPTDQLHWDVYFPLGVLQDFFQQQEVQPLPTGNCFQILGISTASTLVEIKKRYRRLSKQYHPDTSILPPAQATDYFHRLTEAYEVLKNDATRNRYLAGLKLIEASQPEKTIDIEWYPILRCGQTVLVGTQGLRSFLVDKIISWNEIKNSQGQTLVTCWLNRELQERWI